MAHPIQLIVGLGNPGAEYALTRHNAGAWFVERVAQHYGVSLQKEGRFFGLTGRFKLGAQDVWLLNPQTYMNRSGQSVVALAQFFKILPDRILVVHDELDLMPGVARLKSGGGTGGHNGLKDIQSVLGTPNFWRLRVGIGHPRTLQLQQQVADFVLHKPSNSQMIAIDESLEQSFNVLPDMLRGDFAQAMQSLHQNGSSGK
jgi:peptidyl-tRNA hydrolase, PTH1 family